MPIAKQDGCSANLEAERRREATRERCERFPLNQTLSLAVQNLSSWRRRLHTSTSSLRVRAPTCTHASTDDG
jgi:hypothetical protein